ncbi:nitrogenase cofactor biosynthesis protein NifB [Methanogenium sp. MK-MG]|uniref:nitrogenase cofactor biosynthesis protein NifB n=1 Tax=Methanogenium sp. MK-MG TaxID=2599926 RepID=UPI0013EA0AE6|nr:nitrogenase cofactor biosynthesis protein NifB [Methanogenium sp. MK-MG]KAF1076424.1 FeMo cofactor biosynthesis protein NifB [Methanogenium sp. MK-MG]
MTSGEYPTATVNGEEIPYDPDALRKVREHPCYSKDASHKFGRMHLAVAPDCNIQCNYCIRDFDCVNESRPGVCSKVLSPEESLVLVREVMGKFSYIKVIGIAGPGDPLANDETFETLRLLKEEFPVPIKCMSTNGLMLPEHIDLLDEYGVGNVTVTCNAIDPAIGEKIYSFVEWEGKKLHGREAAERLLAQQMKGIEMAVERKMFVKINTVLIPGVNDHHVVDIAKKMGEMGVYTFNIIPVIPQYKFAHITPPTLADKKEMHDACAPYVRQMRHCARCRSDAIGKLGKDVQDEIYRNCGAL